MSRKVFYSLVAVAALLGFGGLVANAAVFGVQDLNSGATPLSMAQQITSGASNVFLITGGGSAPSYTGALGASGIFSNGTAAGLSLNNGIILTTGSAGSAHGPNSSTAISTNNNLAGTAALNAIAGVTTYDAASLSFSFNAATNGSVAFRVIFASDEYPTNAHNDVFAVSLNGQSNIALITGTPITIGNVNQSNLASYYTDNTDGHLNIEYDGLVGNNPSFVVTLSGLTTNQTANHINFAIADGGDGTIDSAVFIGGLYDPACHTCDPVGVPLPASAWGGLVLCGLLGVARVARRKLVKA